MYHASACYIQVEGGALGASRGRRMSSASRGFGAMGSRRDMCSWKAGVIQRPSASWMPDQLKEPSRAEQLCKGQASHDAFKVYWKSGLHHINAVM